MSMPAVPPTLRGSKLKGIDFLRGVADAPRLQWRRGEDSEREGTYSLYWCGMGDRGQGRRSEGAGRLRKCWESCATGSVAETGGETWEFRSSPSVTNAPIGQIVSIPGGTPRMRPRRIAAQSDAQISIVNPTPLYSSAPSPLPVPRAPAVATMPLIPCLRVSGSPVFREAHVDEI
ncbi:hypothetical protein BDK51DRAFT_48519 [Blyttiomyces helicus]|uniref:Uncharacterized protein n=1 Tax=Blyttiomyces helicus TaxID=388810 RepID=A0A4P9W439_9FUNG|nr:hypothetical protein BDK51DRAFT_48519 [Blyttiomyces helicus]|eukprot:RKO84926.1 hypothetical protein BDK51DRAFT_48519 [Blyttiomyces helicus]